MRVTSITLLAHRDMKSIMDTKNNSLINLLGIQTFWRHQGPQVTLNVCWFYLLILSFSKNNYQCYIFI